MKGNLYSNLVRLIKERTNAEDFRCHNAALAVYSFIRHYDQKKRKKSSAPGRGEAEGE